MKMFALQQTYLKTETIDDITRWKTTSDVNKIRLVEFTEHENSVDAILTGSKKNTNTHKLFAHLIIDIIHNGKPFSELDVRVWSIGNG